MFSPASVVTDLINVTSSALPTCFLICVHTSACSSEARQRYLMSACFLSLSLLDKCGEVLICFSLIALWFNAFLVPFKLFVTVIVPVTWTYGAAFLVYEDGVLAFLGLPGRHLAVWVVPEGEP